MEKLARMFLVVCVAFFVFSNTIVMAGGGGSGGVGGGGYSSGITLQQREQIEAQLWSRVSEIQVSAWNQNNFYFAACSPGASGCSSAINNPEPGAYILGVSARAYDDDIASTVYYFNGNTQTVIRPGENFASVKLALNPWQLVKIALPEEISAEETVRLQFKNNGYDSWQDMEITDDGRIAYAFVPLSGTNFSLVLTGKTYPIPAEKIFSSIANSEPVALVQLYVSVERMERYVRVPSEFPSIQAAVNFVPGGSTILIEPGVYEERVDLTGKDGITLLGSLAYPADVVIRSAASNTVFAERGISVKLAGLTIQNDFPGRSSGEKWYSDAALSFDLGVIATIDHVVVESTGSGNVISANYSSVKMSNVTLVGNYFNNGIVMYNNTTDATPDERWRNTFGNLLFYFLDKAVDLENGSARVTDSALYMVRDASDIYYFPESNTWGNPEFLGYYDWNRYLPSADSVVIKETIRKGNGNYPGALMPMKPHTDGGKG